MPFRLACPQKRLPTVKSYEGRKVGIHNHPTNIYPTGTDFVAAASRGYEFGVVVTHDLRVFKYTGPKKKVDAAIIDMIIAKHVKKWYTADENERGFAKAMNIIRKEFGTTWQEVT